MQKENRAVRCFPGGWHHVVSVCWGAGRTCLAPDHSANRHYSGRLPGSLQPAWRQTETLCEALHTRASFSTALVLRHIRASPKSASAPTSVLEAAGSRGAGRHIGIGRTTHQPQPLQWAYLLRVFRKSLQRSRCGSRRKLRLTNVTTGNGEETYRSRCCAEATRAVATHPVYLTPRTRVAPWVRHDTLLQEVMQHPAFGGSRKQTPPRCREGSREGCHDTSSELDFIAREIAIIK
ncbi:hypothetical protein NDU88_003200 [Pleurodeles waltl]|uniref:Uncharacterized protein n=1 Tax=Pleurodeles waltl TaxID=8319 RepID=A0AAV7UDE6_PLEWA|nr:hypothetical protein NDU88_003200 [Pleurodeles waltl]